MYELRLQTHLARPTLPLYSGYNPLSMERQKRLILLTNDDGVQARGLLDLKEELKQLGSVVVVAPYEERSAASHSLTIHQPIRIIKKGPDHYALTGTPVDCVIFAIQKLLTRVPDLMVSGINQGGNLGDDILYSGTVAAAREAALYRIPAVASSLVMEDGSADFKLAARLMGQIIGRFYPKQMPPGTILNINIPCGEPSGYCFTRQGSKRGRTLIEEKRDPRGNKYFWIGRNERKKELDPGTDFQAIREKLVSITPLHLDQTDYKALKNYGELGSPRGPL